MLTETDIPMENCAACSVVIARLLAAPREKVWRAWTDPRHLAQWWGPYDFTNPICQLDVRPGGVFRIVMRGAEGVEFPLTGTYDEVMTAERLVMTLDCSEHPEVWHDLVNPDRDKFQKPSLQAIQVVTFEDVGGQTRLTVRTCFESAAMRDRMVKNGMMEASSESLDCLAAYLQNLA